MDLNYIILYLMLTFPVTTLLQGMFGAINRVLFAAAIVLVFLYLLRKSFTVNNFLVLITTLLIYMWSLFITDGVANNFNDYFYYVFFIIYAFYISYIKDDLINFIATRMSYILTVIRIWNIIVLISMFYSGSYSDGYFCSFTGNVFRLATSATFILALLTLVVPKNKKYIVYSILPMYSLLMGGSRTYLVVGVVIFLILLYIVCGSVKNFIAILVPLALLGIAILTRSSIMNKVTSTLSVTSADYYQDPLIKFTSGRSLFWEADIIAFFEGSWINQLFGYGFNYVYEVNMVAINNDIWAHNDFINILLNFGYIGLVIYVIAYRKLMNTFKEELSVSRILKFAVFFVWLFNAFFNMFYTYTCACVSYPFLILGVSQFIEGQIDLYNSKKAKTMNSLESRRTTAFRKVRVMNN